MARASMHVGSACACTCTGTGAWVNCMHGVECMGVHGRVAGCRVACMPGSACMHVRWWVHTHGARGVHGWVGSIAEVQGGSALHMHGVRSSAYMHGVTIL